MATGKERGGGVLLAVHRRVSAVLMTHPLIADDLDLLLVRLTLPPPQGTVLIFSIKFSSLVSIVLYPRKAL
ncbi:hypothetical protein J6590_028980 [Homalodisca vitripennis]|nr:hypothetical protein J6590_028980 [Homalodisca vitripennis]